MVEYTLPFIVDAPFTFRFSCSFERITTLYIIGLVNRKETLLSNLFVVIFS